MKKLLILTCIICVSLLTSCEAETTEETTDMPSYINPVFGPVMADPTVIRAEDGYYYCYATEDFWDYDSGVHTVAIIKSLDLVNWEFVADAFEEKPDWAGFKNIWAPDIQYFNDTYYLYYSMSVWADVNPVIGVATSDSPAGPFIDQGKLFTSDEIGVGNSIDPNVYTDNTGTKWMFWGSFRGIYAIQLSEDGLSTVGEKTHIAGNSFEASYVVHKDGYYYLFLSTGSCCNGADSTYSVRVLRSTELLGPYVDRSNRTGFQNDGSVVIQSGEQYVGVGHNSMIIDDAGDYWLIYHGIDKDNPYLNNGATRRPLMIDKLVWDSNGWPQVKNFVPSDTDTQAPYIEEEK